MAKKAKTATPTIGHDLTPQRTACAHCGGTLRADYANRRTLHTLAGVARLRLAVRRCHDSAAKSSGSCGTACPAKFC